MKLAAFLTVVLLAVAGPIMAQSTDVSYEERSALRPSLAPDAIADSLYTTARRALNQGSYDAAISGLTRVATRHPLAYVAPNAWYWLAYTLHRRGLESGSGGDLRRALNATIVHRVFYEDAYTRGETIGLARSALDDLATLGLATATDRAVTRNIFAVNYTPCGGRPAVEAGAAALQNVVRLSPPDGATRFDETINGEGLCLDVAPTAGLYNRSGLSSDDKAAIIAAYGRSLHPSAVELLREIENTEPDPVLKKLAQDWLRFH